MFRMAEVRYLYFRTGLIGVASTSQMITNYHKMVWSGSRDLSHNFETHSIFLERVTLVTSSLTVGRLGQKDKQTSECFQYHVADTS